MSPQESLEALDRIAEQFDVWLAKRMLERDLSLRQVAELTGLDHTTIHRLRSGSRNPSFRTAIKLLRALA